MSVNSDSIQNFAAIALTTGLAIVTSQASPLLMMGVVSGIAQNLASNYIGKTNYRQFKSLIKGVDPSELNHDLQKLVGQALEFSIKNIEVLYLKELTNKSDKKELKAFVQKLLSEVKLLNRSIRDKDESIYRLIEKPGNTTEILKTFDLTAETFPVINNSVPFNTFFENQFQANLELAFSELLKNEKNRPALIAYQRAVYKKLDKGLETIICQNERILEKLDSEKRVFVERENTSLRHIRTTIESENTSRPIPEFIQSLDQRQNDLFKEILSVTGEIRADVSVIKSLVKGIGEDLQAKWLPREKVYAGGVFAVAIVVILGLLYSFWSAPFTSNVNIAVDPSFKVHPDYPKLGENSTVLFYFPEETKEKEITFSNELLLVDIPKKLEGEKIKAELKDRYWKLVKDSIALYKGTVFMPILPNERLAKIEGRILSRDGKNLLSGASVFAGGLQGESDFSGRFTISVPLDLRKPEYGLRIEKEGYRPAEEIYYAGTAIEIRLNSE